MNCDNTELKKNDVQLKTSFDKNLFAKSFLDAHNRFRKLHGVSNLRLSESLCVQAEEWANRIAKRRHISFCELAGLGECITFFPEHLSAEEIVNYWYDEHRKYEYETPGWQTGTNYFSQIVWCSTQELGVGRAIVQPIIDSSNRQSSSFEFNADKSKNDNSETKESKKQIVVAFYRPAGNNNRSGQFSLNVFKPIKNRLM